MRTASLLLLVVLFLNALSSRALTQGIDEAETARARILGLRAEIARHDDLYFKQAKPEITDAEYDRLKRELAAWEAAHPLPGEPGPGVGDDRSGLFPIYRHRVPMLSLDKAYTEAEWRAFHARLARHLGQPDPVLVIEPKYDGIAISLTYERGRLTRALTRGNGTEGDDVTANVRTIRNLPDTLHTAGDSAPARVELRGEIYVEHAEFTRINAAREAEGEETFSHPRNLAAGTLKSADSAEAARRRLAAVIHGWGTWEGEGAPASQQAFHAQVRAWGLPAVEEVGVARSAEEAWAAVRALGQKRSQLAFPVDGAVVKLDEVALRGQLGTGALAPRWAIACKYEPARGVTRLRAIVWQVGRTGVLTPVAEFDPVELGGALVGRATLHNRDEIVRRDLRIGDIIEVERAGEVIPAIVGVQLARRPAESRPFQFPDQCPSCQVSLVSQVGEAAVRCPNSRCPARRQRRLEHFASAQGVGLDGFGPATIAALVEAGRLQTPADFYRLRRADLLAVPGVGEKTADRLLAGIERSKQAGLWRFIHGFSVPQVGKRTAQQLAASAGDLTGFGQLRGHELERSAGAAADAVREFLRDEANQEDLRAMVAAGVRAKSE